MKRFLIAILLIAPLLVAQNGQNVGTIPLASQSTIQGLAGTTSVVSYTIFGNAETQGVANYGVLAQGLLTTANGILYTAPPNTTAFISLIILANTSASAVSGVTLAINGSAATATYQVMPGLTIAANGFATVNSQAWEVHDVTGNALSGGGSVTASGTPTIHQLSVFTTATNIKGVSVANNAILAGNTSADPSGKSLADLTPTLYVAGGGVAQAQTATLAPVATALTAGLTVRWLPLAANSGAAPTLAVNGLTATAITKCGATALAASDLTTTAVAVATYDGTQFQLLNPQAVPCISGTVAVGNGGTGATTLAGAGIGILDSSVPPATTPLALSIPGSATTGSRVDHTHRSPGACGAITAESGAIVNSQTQVVVCSMPANFMQVGTTFRVTASGAITTTSTPGNDTFDVRIGTTTLSGNVAATIVAAANAAVTSQKFYLEFLVTVRTAGANGTVVGQGIVWSENAATGAFTSTVIIGLTTSTVAVDTTATKLIELTAVTGAATSSVTFENAAIEIVKM